MSEASQGGEAAKRIESVLLVTPRWARNGGVGAHVMASAAALAGDGLRVGVMAAHLRSDERIPGVSLLHAPRLFDRDAPTHARLGDYSDFAPDVFHLHQMDHPEVLARLRADAPVATSAHGYTACASGLHYFRPGQECSRAHGKGCAAALLARNCAHTRRPDRLPAAYRRAARALAALRAADVAVSYSSAVDRHLAAGGVQRRSLVPLFGTVAAHTGSGHERRRRVVFAGRVVSEKGVLVLIRALRLLDAELVICGEGWQLERSRRLARRLGIADRVRFTGWLAEESLARELAEASVVAAPSLWPEPFGLVGIEALACGRPVVASDTGGTSDWLEHGVNGLLVATGSVRELADALADLLDDPPRARLMGLAGQAMVAERFSPARHVAALRATYDTARSHWLGERDPAPAAAA